MKRRLSKPDINANDISWMVSFSDVITLLITFFVLIISMSSMDDKTIRKSLTYFSGSPGMFGNEMPGSKNFIYFKKKYGLKQEDFIRILKIISKYQVTEIKALNILKLEHLLGNTTGYNVDGNNITINLKGDKVFVDFDYALNVKGKLFLNNLVKMCKNFNDIVKIEVFTTKFPVNTSTIKNNVDLSVKRGVKIATFLTNNGISPKRIEVMGWGYHKISKNLIKIELKNYLKT
jgi:chemotaxis protein MotB